jgi:hypothetical protein
VLIPIQSYIHKIMNLDKMKEHAAEIIMTEEELKEVPPALLQFGL